jgi:glutathione S-transferase
MDSDGAAALAELDKALAARPHADGDAFSAASRHLCVLRARLTRHQRGQGATPESRRRIEHLNAVISVVLAGHFPLGAVPWDELEKARSWLADLLAEVDA